MKNVMQRITKIEFVFDECDHHHLHEEDLILATGSRNRIRLSLSDYWVTILMLSLSTEDLVLYRSKQERKLDMIHGKNIFMPC